MLTDWKIYVTGPSIKHAYELLHVWMNATLANEVGKKTTPNLWTENKGPEKPQTKLT